MQHNLTAVREMLTKLNLLFISLDTTPNSFSFLFFLQEYELFISMASADLLHCVLQHRGFEDGKSPCLDAEGMAEAKVIV